MATSEWFRRVLTAREWNIGLTALEPESLVGSTGPSRVLVPSATTRWLEKPWFVRFQADPFLLVDDGRLFLFYEELLGGSRKGRLCLTELTTDGAAVGRRKVMIRLPCHASYPYVFKHSDAFYCIPETADCRNVVLYRSETPTGPWMKQCTLLSDLPVLDSTVFQFGNHWWLFGTLAGPDLQPSSHLHIWHSPSLEGPWEPHALQPAKIDVGSARPAGRPFLVDGVLYRPAQDCLPRYGARVVINRVLKLTPHDFSEELCCCLEPDPLGPYSGGLHTVTWAGGLTAVDGFRKYRTYNPYKLLTEAMWLVPDMLESVGARFRLSL